MHYIHLSPKEIYLVLKICTNGYHIETINEDKKLYIYIYIYIRKRNILNI